MACRIFTLVDARASVLYSLCLLLLRLGLVLILISRALFLVGDHVLLLLHSVRLFALILLASLVPLEATLAAATELLVALHELIE